MSGEPTELETPSQKTERLLNDAIKSTSALSNHLETVPDKPKMYKVNQAIWILWEIDGK